MKKYGKVLIQALPSETTRLLKRLCLGQYSKWLTVFVQYVIRSCRAQQEVSHSSQLICPCLFCGRVQIRTRQYAGFSDHPIRNLNLYIPVVLIEHLDSFMFWLGETERARPDEFIHIFVNNSSQLTEFLEAMIASEHTPATIVYNTLLELYLQTWAKMSSGTEASKTCV